MIKVDSGYSSVKKKEVSLKVLAEEHYDRVVSNKGNYVSPLIKLEETLTEEEKKGYPNELKVKFLTKVTDKKEFKKLVTAHHSKFESIINDYEEFKPLFEDKGYKCYLELFGYSRLRKLKLMYTFANDLGVKTCLYCNNHYTLTIKKSKKANLHFDHYYAKSDYPFLSLSYFNLIPCCAVCNTTKSDKKVDLKNFIHPYEDSFAKKFDFKTDDDALIDLILDGERELKKVSLNLIPKKGYKKTVQNHDSLFNLKEVYNEHKDVVMEVYSKQYIYTEYLVDIIEKISGKEFEESELERFLLGNYVLEKEINGRPLSKLMQDIRKEATKALKHKTD